MGELVSIARALDINATPHPVGQVTYTAFKPPRHIKEFLGEPGWEATGTLLPFIVLDAHAQTIVRRRAGPAPEKFCVIGEYNREDGRRYLDFAVTSEWIEANSNHRLEEATREYRWKCPMCALLGGKHEKGCPVA